MTDFQHMDRLLYEGKSDEVRVLVEQAVADGHPPDAASAVDMFTALCCAEN